MTGVERKIRKHAKAIKTRVDDGSLSLTAAVGGLITKWLIDHQRAPGLWERFTEALDERKVMPIRDIMARVAPGAANDDWGEGDVEAVNPETADTLGLMMAEADLFSKEPSTIIGRTYQWLLSDERRKRGGIFYPPDAVARLLSAAAGPMSPGGIILDPACGGGALLAAAAEQMGEENGQNAMETLISEGLLGIDTDPVAVIVTRVVLALKTEAYIYPKRILRGDALFDFDFSRWRQVDRVLANPPYLGHKALDGATMKALRARYPRVYGDKGDAAYCFYENAVNRLKPGGRAAFLVSRYFAEAQNGRGLREYLLGETAIRRVIDFNGERIIRGVGIDPMIIVFDKTTEADGRINVFKRELEPRSHPLDDSSSRDLFAGEPLRPASRASSPYQGEPLYAPRHIASPESGEVSSRPGEMTEGFYRKKETKDNQSGEIFDSLFCADCSLRSQSSAQDICPELERPSSHLRLTPESGEMTEGFYRDTETDNSSSLLSTFGTFDRFSVPVSALSGSPWRLIDPLTREMVETIADACGATLGEAGIFFQGVITGADKVFVTDKSQQERLSALSPYFKPWIKNSGIHPCHIDDNNHYLIDIQGDEVPSQALIDYLSPHQAKLMTRRECRTGRVPWYALQWPRKRERFDGGKILFPYKAEKNRFAFDDTGLYFSADVYGYIPDVIDPKALCVLLNSACYNLYVKTVAKKLGGPLYEYYPNTLRRLRIPAPEARIYGELKPYYDIIKTSNHPETAMAEAEAVIAESFAFDEAKMRQIGVKHAKQFF